MNTNTPINLDSLSVDTSFSDLLEFWRNGQRFDIAQHVATFPKHKLLSFVQYGLKYEGLMFISDLLQLIPDDPVED